MAQLLLLEPDLITAEQYKMALETTGHEVALCLDAQSAVLAADKRRPDVVVLELLLAAHSGVEFLYEFRSYPEWQSIPAVVISRTSAQELGLNEALQKRLNVKYALYKPHTNLKRLIQAVNRALEAQTT